MICNQMPQPPTAVLTTATAQAAKLAPASIALWAFLCMQQPSISWQLNRHHLPSQRTVTNQGPRLGPGLDKEFESHINPETLILQQISIVCCSNSWTQTLRTVCLNTVSYRHQTVIFFFRLLIQLTKRNCTRRTGIAKATRYKSPYLHTIA